MYKESKQIIYSIILEKPVLLEILSELLRQFKLHNIPAVNILFGIPWHDDIQGENWDYISIDPDKIPNKLNSIEQKEIGNIGENDFYINLIGTKTDFVFCHESDFHIEFDVFGIVENKMIEYLSLKNIIHPDSASKLKSNPMI